MIATEYELSDISLIEEIEGGGEMVFAVESDDLSEVVTQVARIGYFAREEMGLRDPAVSVAQVIDSVVGQSDVATLMVTHDLPTLTAVDSVYEMVDGRLSRSERAEAA